MQMYKNMDNICLCVNTTVDYDVFLQFTSLLYLTHWGLVMHICVG